MYLKYPNLNKPIAALIIFEIIYYLLKNRCTITTTKFRISVKFVYLTSYSALNALFSLPRNDR